MGKSTISMAIFKFANCWHNQRVKPPVPTPSIATVQIKHPKQPPSAVLPEGLGQQKPALFEVRLQTGDSESIFLRNAKPRFTGSDIYGNAIFSKTMGKKCVCFPVAFLWFRLTTWPLQIRKIKHGNSGNKTLEICCLLMQDRILWWWTMYCQLVMLELPATRIA